jgi:hypothetical protein
MRHDATPRSSLVLVRLGAARSRSVAARVRRRPIAPSAFRAQSSATLVQNSRSKPRGRSRRSRRAAPMLASMRPHAPRPGILRPRRPISPAMTGRSRCPGARVGARPTTRHCSSTPEYRRRPRRPVPLLTPAVSAAPTSYESPAWLPPPYAGRSGATALATPQRTGLHPRRSTLLTFPPAGWSRWACRSCQVPLVHPGDRQLRFPVPYMRFPVPYMSAAWPVSAAWPDLRSSC